jgi:hypothetical protein
LFILPEIRNALWAAIFLLGPWLNVLLIVFIIKKKNYASLFTKSILAVIITLFLFIPVVILFKTFEFNRLNKDFGNFSFSSASATKSCFEQVMLPPAKTPILIETNPNGYTALFVYDKRRIERWLEFGLKNEERKYSRYEKGKVSKSDKDGVIYYKKTLKRPDFFNSGGIFLNLTFTPSTNKVTLNGQYDNYFMSKKGWWRPSKQSDIALTLIVTIIHLSIITFFLIRYFRKHFSTQLITEFKILFKELQSS